MSKKRLWLALAFAGLASVCATAVHAVALGAGSGEAILGQPLDFAVLMRLGNRESAAVDCLGAEVQVGERRLMPSQVRFWVEPVSSETARIRVQTLGAIDEPVISLTVTSACGTAISKRYIVLADPPANAPAAATVLPRALPLAVAAVPQVDTTLLLDLSVGAAGALPVERPAAGSRANGPVVLLGGTWRAVGLRRPVAATSGRTVRRPRAAVREKAQTLALASPQRLPHKRQAGVSALPRLKLDIAEPMLKSEGAVEQALQAVAQAAAAARQAASAASSAADRIAALERTVDQLRGEARNSRSEAAQLRQQIAGAESSTSTWLLGALALGMALLAVFLATRLSVARRSLALAGESGMSAVRLASMTAEAAERPPTAAMAFVHSELDSVPMSAPRTRAAPAWPPPAPTDGWLPSQPPDIAVRRGEPAPSLSRATTASPRFPGGENRIIAQASTVNVAMDFSTSTAAPPAEAAARDSAARDVSIDELLDLEQQAEFFVVLGQDDAAIELLVEHLRHTGGSSPLPYLKLLEIHRRRGSRSDYERMRARFNHQFNAYAPEWEVDLLSGRSLDDYPGVLPRLERAWTRPTEGMAELEAMIFQKSQGELFDLPAYREVLFLYAVARELLDRESAASGTVDLLLPLADASAFSKTSPMPFLGSGQESRSGSAGREPRSIGLVDLDLSLDSSRPTSIFDPLQEAPTHPGSR